MLTAVNRGLRAPSKYCRKLVFFSRVGSIFDSLISNLPLLYILEWGPSILRTTLYTFFPSSGGFLPLEFFPPSAKELGWISYVPTGPYIRPPQDRDDGFSVPDSRCVPARPLRASSSFLEVRTSSLYRRDAGFDFSSRLHTC